MDLYSLTSGESGGHFIAAMFRIFRLQTPPDDGVTHNPQFYRFAAVPSAGMVMLVNVL
jgi:hypothetical protein